MTRTEKFSNSFNSLPIGHFLNHSWINEWKHSFSSPLYLCTCFRPIKYARTPCTSVFRANFIPKYICFVRVSFSFFLETFYVWLLNIIFIVKLTIMYSFIHSFINFIHTLCAHCVTSKNLYSCLRSQKNVQEQL